MPCYKYCIVPDCSNTTIKTPNKLFFNVPRDMKMRKKWCKAMKRKLPSERSTLYCCEDHFKIEQDMENYIRYKLMGGQLRLKKGVLPHKFDCQKPQKKTIERGAFKKRRQIEFLERVLSKDICHEDLQVHPIEVIECDDIPHEDTQVHPSEVIKCEYKTPAESSQEENNIKIEINGPIESENLDPIEPTDCEIIEPVESEEVENNINDSDNNDDDPFECLPVVQVEMQTLKSIGVQVKLSMRSKSTNTPPFHGRRRKCQCRCICGGR